MAGTCVECGGPVAPSRRKREYCSHKCRLTRNNRRRDRGAVLYDMLESIRYYRDDAKRCDLDYQTMCRLMMHWHNEDKARGIERTGRSAYAVMDDWRAIAAAITNTI